MNELLNLAVNSHGGLERWNKVNSVKVAASITGAIWYVKNQGNALQDVVMTIDTRDERLVTDFPGQDKRSTFEPNRIVMEKVDGTLIGSRNNPEESFKGQQRETPWDDMMSPISAGRLCGLTSTLRSSTRTRDSRPRRSPRFRWTARRGGG